MLTLKKTTTFTAIALISAALMSCGGGGGGGNTGKAEGKKEEVKKEEVVTAKAKSGKLSSVDTSDPTKLSGTTASGKSGEIALANPNNPTFPNLVYETGLDITGSGIATTDMRTAGGWRGNNADDPTIEEYQIFGTVVSGDQTESFASQRFTPALSGQTRGNYSKITATGINYAYSYGNAKDNTVTPDINSDGEITVEADGSLSGTMGAIAISGNLSGTNIINGTSTLTIPGHTVQGGMEGVLTVDDATSGTSTSTYGLANLQETAGVFNGSDGKTISYAGAFKY